MQFGTTVRRPLDTGKSLKVLRPWPRKRKSKTKVAATFTMIRIAEKQRSSNAILQGVQTLRAIL